VSVTPTSDGASLVIVWKDNSAVENGYTYYENGLLRGSVFQRPRGLDQHDVPVVQRVRARNLCHEPYGSSDSVWFERLLRPRRGTSLLRVVESKSGIADALNRRTHPVR